MQIQILPDRKLVVERKRLRHEANRAASFHIVGAIGLPNNLAQPSVTGRSPVIIFMVVVFPQPFEPRNPKISPRPMRKLTWSTATKSPNRRVSPSASIAAVLSCFRRVAG